MTTEAIIQRPHQAEIEKILRFTSELIDDEIESGGLDHPLVASQRAFRDAISEGMYITDEGLYQRIAGLQPEIDGFRGIVSIYTHNEVGRALYQRQLGVLEMKQDGYAFVIEGTIKSKITGR